MSGPKFEAVEAVALGGRHVHLGGSGAYAARLHGVMAPLIVAIVAAGAVFVTFLFTTLIHEPASIVAIAVILVLSVALDYGWKHFHDTRTKSVQPAH